LWLLGFNTVGGQSKETRAKFQFREPGHSWVNFAPSVTRANAAAQMAGLGEKYKKNPPATNTIFTFSDEVTAPVVGANETALANFRAWLTQQKITPQELGVTSLDEATPIDNPEQLRERQNDNKSAANRLFYLTSRFRQLAASERFGWLTDSLHQSVSNAPISSTLVADHPYFSGTGLGMGMGPNPAWSSTPLALDCLIWRVAVLLTWPASKIGWGCSICMVHPTRGKVFN